MSTITKTTKPQEVFELARFWHKEDVKWLIERLQSLAEKSPLPENETGEETENFTQVAQYVLQKNQELYNRFGTFEKSST